MSKDFFTRHLAIIASGALLLITVILFGFMAAFEPLGLDAGYYLTSGRLVANGFIPNVDFPSPYPPGPYYVFAIIEQLFDASPTAHKLFIYILHLLNGYILFSILRKLGHEPRWAAVFATFFVAWIFTLDGQKIELEPIQNLFLLLSFRVILQRSDPWGILTAGLLGGCALMTKQSSMFSIPTLLLFATLPALITQSGASLKIDQPAMKRAAIFLTCLGIPFAIYVALTGQNFVTSLWTFMTFGGDAAAYSEQYHFSDFLETLLDGNRGQILLIPVLGIAGLLLIFAPTRQNLFFAAFMALTMLPILFIRGYGHYVQLFAPWAVIAIAMFVSSLSNLAAEGNRDFLRSLLAMLLFLILLPPYMYRVREITQDYAEYPIASQQRLASEIKEILPDRTDTLVVGLPWLYYLADITPPNRDLMFTNSIIYLEPRLNDANRVIVVPWLGYAREVEEIEQLILAGGFTAAHTLIWHGRDVVIFEKF